MEEEDGGRERRKGRALDDQAISLLCVTMLEGPTDRASFACWVSQRWELFVCALTLFVCYLSIYVFIGWELNLGTHTHAVNVLLLKMIWELEAPL